jgi:hypothetical protein
VVNRVLKINFRFEIEGGATQALFAWRFFLYDSPFKDIKRLVPLHLAIFIFFSLFKKFMGV